MGDEETSVKVSEDLRPLELQDTANIHEARGYDQARGRWAAAVSSSLGPRYLGGGSVPRDSSVVTAAAAFSTAGTAPPAASAAPSLGNFLCSSIVSFDRVEHRDVPDAALDNLYHVRSDCVPQGLARVVDCDPWELRGYATGTLVANLCHTVVSLGDLIRQWAHDSPGVPLPQL